MSQVDQKDLAEFGEAADAWFAEHTVRDPGFRLPLTFMEVGEDRQFEFLRDWQRKVWEAGYLGAAWPKECGGGGLDPAFQRAADSAMRKHNAPIMLNAIGLGWTGPLLLDIGTDELRAKYCKGILSAEDIWCQGFSEPEHGSDLGSAQTKAVRDGDAYVINGSKIWTTLGNYAKFMILLARTNPEAESRYAGLSFFLAPMTVPGVETVPIKKLTGEFGFTQTFFRDARIPAEGLIGAEGDGWKVAMRTLEYERGARGGQAGGQIITRRDELDIIELAKNIRRGDGAAIDDPVVQDKLIEFMIEIQGNRLCNDRRAITPLNQDYPFGLELSSKLRFTEMDRRLNEFAVTMAGSASGYYVGDPNAVEDGLWTRGYLNAFSATIGGGTSEVQRNILGEHVLGLPKK